MKRTWQTLILCSLVIQLASCGTPAVQPQPAGEATLTAPAATIAALAPTGAPSPSAEEPAATSTPPPTAEESEPTRIPPTATAEPTSTSTPPPTATPFPPPPTLTPSATPLAIFLADDIQRITPADAKALVDSGRAVLYDVRSANQYRAKHAAGALSFPEARMTARYGELPTSKSLIFY